ncbi:MAG: carbohydrate kinase [Methylotenera sp.]
MQRNLQQNNLKNNTVVLFGEVLADIFPDESVLGGAPFNVARHLSAFDLNSVMMSRTGNDALRDDFMREMQRLNMDVSGIQIDHSYPTGQVQVELANGKHQFNILPNQAYDHIHAGITHMMTLSIKPDLVYFGTLAQRAMTSRLALDKLLSDSNCPRFFDINLRHPWYNKHTVRRSLLRSDIVKMNEEELEIVASYFKINADHPQSKAKLLLEQFALKMLLITCGENGAWLVNADHEVYESVPQKTTLPIVDTVGAGDAFSAVVMLGLLNRWDLSLVLKRANQFASAICGIRGGAPKDKDFYLPFKQEWSL